MLSDSATRELVVIHLVFLFVFHDPATTEIYTLSLHDALPIYVSILASCKSAGRFLSMELRATNSSRSGGVFHGCRCAPISPRRSSPTSRRTPSATGSIAT